jgi:Fe-S-cluster containining protein
MTRFLADESGACKHLSKDNTCSIYENRPDICRVDLMLERMGYEQADGHAAVAALCNEWMQDDGMTSFVQLTVNETGR